MKKRVFSSIVTAGVMSMCSVLLLDPHGARAAVAPVVSTLSAISDGTVTPVRVAADQQGNYYVSDPRGGGVLKYNSAGTLLQKIATTSKNLLGIAVAQNGDVLVSQGAVVAVYSAAGAYKTSFGTFGVANGITLDDTGTIFVVDSKYNKVLAFSGADYSATGVSFGTQGTGIGQFRQPTGISFEKVSKQLAVVDTLNGRIQFFDTTGAYKKNIGSFGSGPMKFTSPQAVAFEYTSAGSVLSRIYVVDSFQANIQVIDGATSTFLRYVGNYGFRSGQLITPGDLILDSFNRLVIPNGTGALVLFAVEGSTPVTPNTPAVSFPSSSTGTSQNLTVSAPALSTVSGIVVSGTVASGATVTVNGVSATVSGTTWTAPVTLTQQGLNNIVVTATGSGGSSSVSSYVTLDSVPPVLQTVIAPKPGSVTGTPVQTIVGTVADSSATTVTVAVAGVTQTVPVNDGVFTATVKLAGGNNVITVTATDAGGQTTTSSSSVTYSPLAPTLVVTTPAGAVSNSASYTVSGVTQAGNSVTVNGVTATLSGAGNTAWTATIPLTVGLNPVTVIATAPSGSSSSTFTSSAVYSPDQPALAVTVPALDSATARKNTILLGQVEQGATVTATVDGVAVPVTVAADGSFNVPITFSAAGAHTVAVTAISSAGVIASSRRTLVYDPAPPQLAVLDATPGAIKVSSSNGVVVARDKNGIIGSATGNGTSALDLSTATYDQSSLNIEVLTPAGLSSRDGNINGGNDGAVTLADALLAAQISLGMTSATFEQRLRGDVGPLVNHVSVPDGKIGLDDMMLILQKAIGLEW
jgi:hypothetical protein